jgi:hypothetical protein
MMNGGYVLIVPPKDYNGRLYRNKYAYEHQVVWWFYNKLPPALGEDIHHVNENKLNNRIANLELLSHKDHVSHHCRSQAKLQVVQRHLLDREFREYMRTVELKIKRWTPAIIFKKTCKCCHVRFETKNAYAKFCSSSCSFKSRPLLYKLRDLRSSLSDSEIARRYGVSPNAIRKARVKFGIKQ